MRSLGEAGEIEPETEGILIQYDIDTSEFSNEVSIGIQMFWDAQITFFYICPTRIMYFGF